MNIRLAQFTSCLGLSVLLALGVSGVHAAPAAPKVTLTPQEQKFEAQYAAKLAGLQAELTKALPAIPDARKAALQQARVAVTKATAEAKKAQEAQIGRAHV